VERYLEIADRHRLLVTGGSDCLGMSKGQPLIGTVKLPYSHVQELKQRVARKKSSPANAHV
jgi:putative NADH-flavin reductase